MTDEEEIEKAARIINKSAGSTFSYVQQFQRDIAREILAPHLAKIAGLDAEVTALRKRLVIDETMVERAMSAMYPGEWEETVANATTDDDAAYIAESRREMRAVLDAALKDDANE